MTEHLTPAQRATYIDNSQHFAREVLFIPEVQRRLGHYTNELFSLTNSMAPVSIKDGNVSTDELSLDQTPVAVLRAGEEVARAASIDVFDVFQRQAMIQRFGIAETNDLEQRHKKLSGMRAKPLHILNKELGYVSTDDVDTGDGRRVKNRPLLVLNYDKSHRLYAAAPLLFHEFTHVTQRREMPLWNENEISLVRQDISDELEAYAIAAMTILGIQDANEQHNFLTSIPRASIEKALEIEEIRQSANRFETDPFAASNKVALELVNHGHGITPFLKDQIARS